MNMGQGRRTRSRLLATSALTLVVSVALAQELPPPPVFPPTPEQPAPAPVPAPVFQQAPPPTFVDPALQAAPPQGESAKQTLKRLFAGTLATVAQTTGTTLLVGLTQAITGGLTDWFGRKLKVQPGAVQAQALPAPAFPPASGVPTLPPAPVFSGQSAQTLPPPVFTDPAAPTLPPPPAFGSPVQSAPPQFFDAQTGALTAPDPVFASALAAPTDSTAVFAGLAFEVHAVAANGATTPVNPATHEFRTGDRFVVFYRPTLPGQMNVFNINAAGVRTQIDRVDLAGGQLSQLGPYEFAALKGDEQLKLVVSPCQTPALLAQTRDIINVSATSAAAPAAAPAFNLAGCSPVTRSIREVPTRDIRKVAVEGTTGFALDPVTSAEFGSGQVTPREVTITFRHR